MAIQGCGSRLATWRAAELPGYRLLDYACEKQRVLFIRADTCQVAGANQRHLSWSKRSNPDERDQNARTTPLGRTALVVGLGGLMVCRDQVVASRFQANYNILRPKRISKHQTVAAFSGPIS
jgi:hypothetical protein